MHCHDARIFIRIEEIEYFQLGIVGVFFAFGFIRIGKQVYAVMVVLDGNCQLHSVGIACRMFIFDDDRPVNALFYLIDIIQLDRSKLRHAVSFRFGIELHRNIYEIIRNRTVGIHRSIDNRSIGICRKNTFVDRSGIFGGHA